MHESHGDDPALPRVAHLYDAQVVPQGRYLECLLIAGLPVRRDVEHVAQQEGRTFLLDGIRQETQGHAYVGPVGCRAELEHFADYMQQMLPSLCRAYELLHLV